MGGGSKLLTLLSTPFPLLRPRPITIRLAHHSKLAALTPLRTLTAAAALRPCHRRLSSLRPFPQFHTHATARDDGGGAYALESSVTIGGEGGREWPEWRKLVDRVTGGGYVERRVVEGDDDSFTGLERLPEGFGEVAGACLSFSRERPELLRRLSRKDVEVVALNGSPFLFKDGLNSSTRIRAFLAGEENSAVSDGKAETVDIMRYLLGYVYNHLVSSQGGYSNNMENVEVSVRNLFRELVDSSGALQGHTMPQPSSLEQTSYRRNIEMKRGDWICHKCQFMNFARNMKCLECNEMRPQRQLAGGEWECPQCDFFNYGRNMACLRCDCRRPGPAYTHSNAATSAAGYEYDENSKIREVYNGNNTKNTEIDRRLAENDEKAERWFNKVSQMDDKSYLSNAIADEDFPEIMPLRKGVSKFVVSQRKTSLERRLSNEQYKRNMVSDGSSKGNEPGTFGSTISSTIDRIIGQTQGKNDIADLSTIGQVKTGGSPQRRDPGSINMSTPLMPVNPTENKMDEMVSANSDDEFPDIMPMRKGENRFVISKKKDRSLTTPPYKRRLAMEQANSSNFVPFVPFPPGYFAKKDTDTVAGNSNIKTEAASSSSSSKNVQNVHENLSDTDSNHLKSESLYSSHRRESQKSIGDNIGRSWNPSMSNLDGEHPISGSLISKSWNDKDEPDRNRFIHQDGSHNLNHGKTSDPSSLNNNKRVNYETSMNYVKGSSPTPLSETNRNESWRNGYDNDGSIQHSVSNSRDSQVSESFPRAYSRNIDSTSNIDSMNKSSQHSGTSQNVRQGLNGGFTGKSLEGSAVTEPDPLDMSEEAKAQRWFRRVAQITDISELSKIPDEDFPSIMPMRKGVNRFVVSKRKTPLERRLTSPQYRRNLPIVSSESEKNSKEGNS